MKDVILVALWTAAPFVLYNAYGAWDVTAIAAAAAITQWYFLLSHPELMGFNRYIRIDEDKTREEQLKDVLDQLPHNPGSALEIIDRYRHRTED